MSSLGLITLTSFDYMKEFSGKNRIILKCQKKQILILLYSFLSEIKLFFIINVVCCIPYVYNTVGY